VEVGTYNELMGQRGYFYKLKQVEMDMVGWWYSVKEVTF
jgi:hypothetical protein